MLGFCYDHDRGMAKDEVEAVKWIRKAAEQNLVSAQKDLAEHFEKGQGIE